MISIQIQKISKLLVNAFGFFVLSQTSLSQIKTHEQALARGVEFLRSIGVESSLEDLNCTESSGSNLKFHYWNIASQKEGVDLALTSDSGRIIAYTNSKELAIMMKQTGLSRKIADENAAWAEGERVLGLTGTALDSLERVKCEPLADTKNASRDKANLNGRYILSWKKRVDPYAGEIDSATLSLNVFTGKVVSLTGPVGYTYVKPSQVLTQTMALDKLNSFLDQNSGNPEIDQFRRSFDLSDKESVIGTMALTVRSVHDSVFGSSESAKRAYNLESRLVWRIRSGSAEIEVDAESGVPLLYGASKSGSSLSNLDPVNKISSNSQSRNMYWAFGIIAFGGISIAMLLKRAFVRIAPK